MYSLFDLKTKKSHWESGSIALKLTLDWRKDLFAPRQLNPVPSVQPATYSHCLGGMPTRLRQLDEMGKG